METKRVRYDISLIQFGKFARLHVITLAVAIIFFSSALHAATLLQNISLSPDITIMLNKIIINDENVGFDNLTGTVNLINIGQVPATTELNAYHRLNKTDQLVSFDTTVALKGVIAEARDVINVNFNGLIYTYQKIFDASAQGIPSGVLVDAIGVRDGDIILSFDTSVSLGFIADDEDLVIYNTKKGFFKFFDGSDAGVSPALDVDGVHVLDTGDLLLSFDGSGEVDGVTFDDEDILEYLVSSNTWNLIYDGSIEHASLKSADVNAFAAVQLDVPACEADFDGDGDVDGSDLAVFISNGAGISLGDFTDEFGRVNCPAF